MKAEGKRAKTQSFFLKKQSTLPKVGFGFQRPQNRKTVQMVEPENEERQSMGLPPRKKGKGKRFKKKKPSQTVNKTKKRLDNFFFNKKLPQSKG